MGRDNHPKVRQARQLERKLNRKGSYDRVLIVCEGSKTEPNYFENIRKHYRLHTANVGITHGEWGTEPIQIAEFAEHIFLKGDELNRIKPRSFEKVYVVFDRDEHKSYFNALSKVAALNNAYQNDLRQFVSFSAVISKPCFEFWLLLHYENVTHLIHRAQALARVQEHIPGYVKGSSNIYDVTMTEYETAKQRALRLNQSSNPYDETQPYTNIHELVDVLRQLGGSLST